MKHAINVLGKGNETQFQEKNANKTHFPKKRFGSSPVLKVRVFGTK